MREINNRKIISFINHIPENSKKLMFSVKYNFLQVKNFYFFFMQVIGEILISSDCTNFHRKDNFSQMSVSSNVLGR